MRLDFGLLLVALLAPTVGARASDLPIDPFHQEWIGKHLRAMHEPMLQDMDAGGPVEIYRYLALPSFTHPISIRVVVGPSGEASATVRTSTGLGGYGAGTLTGDHAVRVSPEDLAVLRAELGESFRALHTDEQSNELDDEGKPVEHVTCSDGTASAFEVVRAGTYHLVFRGCSMEGQLGRAVETFKHIARPYLPANVDEYVPY